MLEDWGLKMNLRLSVIFLALAAILIVGVFNYGAIVEKLGRQDETGTGPIKKADLTKPQVLEFMQSQKWFDYASVAQSIDTSRLTGSKVVYIHLWASWCGPCLNEIPEMIKYAKANTDQTQFIVVSLDESQIELEKFLKSFPELRDPIFINIWDYDKSISKKLDVDRLPMTVILKPSDDAIRNIRSVVEWKSL